MLSVRSAIQMSSLTEKPVSDAFPSLILTVSPAVTFEARGMSSIA